MANAPTNSQRKLLFDLIEQRGLIGGRFKNPQRLGAGAFSLVLSADDTQTGRRIALKFLDPFVREPYRQSCFQREAEILTKLTGQRDIIELIAPLAVHNEALPVTLPGGLPSTFPLDLSYFALELAASDGLAWLVTNPTPTQKIAAFRAMCRSVQRLHSHRLAHRDLKLDNFLFMPTGEPRLADFGTVREVDGPALASTYDIPVGDLRFTAPELIGLLHDANPEIGIRADFFSLGCALYQMFTGLAVGSLIYDDAFISDLVQVMRAVLPERRKQIFNGTISAIRDARPLPSLSISPKTPASIRPLLEGLYFQLTDLDYRRRLCNFETIFLRLNVLLEVLEHEDQFHRFQSRRTRTP